MAAETQKYEQYKEHSPIFWNDDGQFDDQLCVDMDPQADPDITNAGELTDDAKQARERKIRRKNQRHIIMEIRRMKYARDEIEADLIAFLRFWYAFRNNVKKIAFYVVCTLAGAAALAYYGLG